MGWGNWPALASWTRRQQGGGLVGRRARRGWAEGAAAHHGQRLTGRVAGRNRRSPAGAAPCGRPAACPESSARWPPPPAALAGRAAGRAPAGRDLAGGRAAARGRRRAAGGQAEGGQATLARNLALAVARATPSSTGPPSRPGGLPGVGGTAGRAWSATSPAWARQTSQSTSCRGRAGGSPGRGGDAATRARAGGDGPAAAPGPPDRRQRLCPGHRAFEPLLHPAHAGCHICCVHHLGKGDRPGATPSWAARPCTRRWTRSSSCGKAAGGCSKPASGSAPRCPPPRCCGTRPAAPSPWPPATTAPPLPLAERILAALATAPEGGLSTEQLLAAIGGDTVALRQALRALHAMGRVARRGAGRRGDPYLFTVA